MNIPAGSVSLTPLEHVAGNMLAVIFAFAVGIFSETRKHLAEPISQRKGADLELRQLNGRLGQEVERRSRSCKNRNRNYVGNWIFAEAPNKRLVIARPSWKLCQALPK